MFMGSKSTNLRSITRVFVKKLLELFHKTTGNLIKILTLI